MDSIDGASGTEEVPPDNDDPSAIRLPCLLVLAGRSAGRVYTLLADETTLGRSQDADIVLNDAGVSRAHARILKTGAGEFQIVDLNSKNGTRIGQQPISSCELRDGDTIRVGTAILKFSRQHEIEVQLQAHLYEIASHAGLPEAARNELADILRSHTAQAVGQLAAGIAHEINSPLGAILMCLEDAQRKVETQPQTASARMERAYNAALRARDVINKLLWYSRESAGERHAVSLRDVVSDVAQFLGRAFAEEGIDVQCDLGEVRPVLGNRHELQQVAVNLMQNARDAVLADGAPGRRVHVVTRNEGEEVVLEVADTGPGIAPETLARIFDPFFTTRTVGDGTGLGLSVSQQIARAHGGSLTAHSPPGGPTTFRLTLPVRAD